MTANARQDSPAGLVAGLAAMRAAFGEASTAGLAPALAVQPAPGWFSATELVHGERLDALTAGPAERWQAPSHAAASLAWKAYAYWVGLPVVTAWTLGAPVPDVSPHRTLVRLLDTSPFVQIALLPLSSTAEPLAPDPRQAGYAVLPGRDTAERVRATMLQAHLLPLLERLVGLSRISRRTLTGELAYGLACQQVRAASMVAEPAVATSELLVALGLRDLVDVSQDTASRPSVRRQTCCLALAVPALRHVCADCVVNPPSPTRQTPASRAAVPDEVQRRALRPAIRPAEGAIRHA